MLLRYVPYCGRLKWCCEALFTMPQISFVQAKQLANKCFLTLSVGIYQVIEYGMNFHWVCGGSIGATCDADTESVCPLKIDRTASCLGRPLCMVSKHECYV